MRLAEELKARGIPHQWTDESLFSAINNEHLTLYVGFDPSADSLHVGSLFPLITMKRFQEAGHPVIAVLGGATGMIGDPSGKSTERVLLEGDVLKHNIAGIRQNIEQILDPVKTRVINNADFYSNQSVIDFLRDVGKHFTVNHMVAKDSVRSRMEDRDHGISYTEFSYMLLQAYDFYVLHRDYGCRLQIGASDQWGNITEGCELIRRKGSKTQTFGLTHPLITKADGTKFGKTESGTIWLDPKKTSPYQFYQFFIQVPDDQVLTLLNWLTFISLEEITVLEKSLKIAPERKDAQTRLAQAMTELVHGKEALSVAEIATKALFSEDIITVSKSVLASVIVGAPQTRKAKSAISDGVPLVDALVETGLFSSKGAARKDILAGGVYVNNVRSADPGRILNEGDLIQGLALLLRKGKRNYHWLMMD